jgi:hypothetical protein
VTACTGDDNQSSLSTWLEVVRNPKWNQCVGIRKPISILKTSKKVDIGVGATVSLTVADLLDLSARRVLEP